LDQSIRDFVSEAEDILENLENSISQLMDISTDDYRKPDIINAIFRSAHSLKGLSGMLNLDNLSDLSHHIESLLDSIRLDKIALSSEVVDLLSYGVQLIVRMVHAVADGAGDGAVNRDDFLRDLERISSGQVSREGPDLSEFVALPEGLTEVLSEYEEHRFRDNIDKRVPLYRVVCHLPLETFDVQLRELNNGIKEVGELLTTLPQTDGGEEGTIGFQLFFTSREEENLIRERLRLNGMTLEGVPYRSDGPSRPAAEKQFPVEMERDLMEDEIKGVSNSVRVDIAKLDNLMNLVGELVILRSNFTNIASRLKEVLIEVGSESLLELDKSNAEMEKKLVELRDSVMDIRMVPMGQLFSRLQRVSKKIARELNKKVTLEFSGGDTELDKMIMEEMVSPLLHMVRNSIDHGIEDAGERKAKGKPEIGQVRLSAYQQGNHVVLEVEDDGAGIDMEKVVQSGIRRGVLDEGVTYSEEDVVSLLFRPGFSTKDTATEISGRGVGMDVVRKELENIGGAVEIQSVKDKGTRVTLTLPITLAILQALMIRAGQRIFAVPLGSIEETIQLLPGDIKTMKGREVVNLRDRTLPLLRLEDIFNQPREDTGEETFAIIIRMGNRTMGLAAGELLGKQDIVIKPLGETFSKTVGLAGAAELGDQSTVLVLDVAGLMMEAIRLGSMAKRV
jgi:two-component system chemotaxis sensor kinase CheA